MLQKHNIEMMSYTAPFLLATHMPAPSIIGFGSRDQWTGNLKIMPVFLQDIHLPFSEKGAVREVRPSNLFIPLEIT